jgi:hypothetical protein
MSMTKAEVVELAKDKDDVELQAVGRKHGLLNLACYFDGVALTPTPHKSSQFTRENPFVHLAIREGFVERATKDISKFREFQGNPVSVSFNAEGEQAPIEHVIFRGEESIE